MDGFIPMNNKEYAGFWIRVGATLIDTIILMIVLFIPIGFFIGAESYANSDPFTDLLLNFIIPMAITVWFWRKYLATPGKMALRLKVVDAVTGEKMTTGQAIGRYFAYIPAMLPLCLGLIWVGVDKKKQGWHDKLAGTVVIRDIAKEAVRFDGIAE